MKKSVFVQLAPFLALPIVSFSGVAQARDGYSICSAACRAHSTATGFGPMTDSKLCRESGGREIITRPFPRQSPDILDGPFGQDRQYRLKDSDYVSRSWRRLIGNDLNGCTFYDNKNDAEEEFRGFVGQNSSGRDDYVVSWLPEKSITDDRLDTPSDGPRPDRSAGSKPSEPEKPQKPHEPEYYYVCSTDGEYGARVVSPPFLSTGKEAELERKFSAHHKQTWSCYQGYSKDDLKRHLAGADKLAGWLPSGVKKLWEPDLPSVDAKTYYFCHASNGATAVFTNIFTANLSDVMAAESLQAQADGAWTCFHDNSSKALEKRIRWLLAQIQAPGTTLSVVSTLPYSAVLARDLAQLKPPIRPSGATTAPVAAQEDTPRFLSTRNECLSVIDSNSYGDGVKALKNNCSFPVVAGYCYSRPNGASEVEISLYHCGSKGKGVRSYSALIQPSTVYHLAGSAKFGTYHWIACEASEKNPGTLNTERTAWDDQRKELVSYDGVCVAP